MTSPDTETESPILPAHIEETVQAIARLHAQHRQGATRVQRLVEGLTRGVGRPSAAGVLALAAAGWIGVNLALQLDGRPAPDPLPLTTPPCDVAFCAKLTDMPQPSSKLWMW